MDIMQGNNLSKGEKKSEFHEKLLLYGWFKLTPKCLQVLNVAVWVLVFFSLGNAFQSGIVNGLLGVALTTIERRFELSSSQSSWIASAYEFGSVPVLIAFSYIGSRVHRPRILSMGFTLCGIGCLLFVLPHFLTPVYHPNAGDGEDMLCRDRSNDTSPCQYHEPEDNNESISSISSYIWFFIFGRFLHGIGGAPTYNWGVTYLDDCVSKDSFSFYIGIFYSMGLIGPAVAVILGGYLLTIYTDFGSIDKNDLDIEPGDPSWIGAWWFGYVIFGILCFCIAIPISGYGRDIPGAEEIRKEKHNEAYISAGEKDNSSKGTADVTLKLKELPHHLYTLIKNIAYLCLTVCVTCDSLIIAGFTAFGPKYVENQFALIPSTAGTLFGLVLLPAGTLGTVLGGWVIKKRQMSCETICKWETIQTVIILSMAFLFFIYCDPINFAGITVPYSINNNTELNLTDLCNVDCMCDDLLYSPVCGSDNVQYFSACHAGCQILSEGPQISYYNCSCIDRQNIEIAYAIKGECETSSCASMSIFFFFFFFEVFLFFSCSTMNISATIRSVPNKQRSLAIGIQWILLRLLGTVPGPVIFGLAFDGSCSLWSETCGEQGSCLFYENLSISIYLFIVCVAVKGISLVAIIIAWYYYKTSKKVDCIETAVIDVTSNESRALEDSSKEPGKKAQVTKL